MREVESNDNRWRKVSIIVPESTTCLLMHMHVLCVADLLVYKILENDRMRAALGQ